VETCKICGSLIIKKECTNTHCGEVPKLGWQEDPSHFLEETIRKGRRDLILARRAKVAPKLRGIKG